MVPHRVLVIAARNQSSAAARHAQTGQPGIDRQAWPGPKRRSKGLFTRFFALGEAPPDPAGQPEYGPVAGRTGTAPRIASPLRGRRTTDAMTMSYNIKREQALMSLITAWFR